MVQYHKQFPDKWWFSHGSSQTQPPRLQALNSLDFYHWGPIELMV